MQKRSILWWLAGALLLAAAAAPARAQVFYRRDPGLRPAELDVDGRLYKPAGQLELALLRLHPFFCEELLYDSNVFLAHRHGNVEADVLSRTTAGLRLDAVLDGRHEILAGYQLHLAEYLGRSEGDGLEHDALVSGALNLDFLFVDVRNRLQKLIDPADLVNADRVDRWKNSFFARAGVFAHPLLVEAVYENRWFEFDAPLQSLDRIEHYLTLAVHLLLREDSANLQQVFAFAAYEYGRFHFRSSFSNDSDLHTLWIGAKGTFREDLPFLLKIGYTLQRAGSDGTNTDHHDYEGMVWETRLTYRIEQRHSVYLACYRHIEVSGSSNYRTYDRGEIGGELQLPSHITENFYAGAHLFFDTAHPSRAPLYNRVGLGLRLEYALQDWAHLGLRYEHAYRYTNMPAGDYRVHRLAFHATVFF